MIFGMGMLLALVGVSNYYIVKRLRQSLSYVFPKIHRGIYWGLFVLLTLLLVTGFARTSLPISATAKEVLGLVNAYWMGIFVYLLFFLLIADLILLICRLVKLTPKPLPHKIRALSGAVAVTVALGTCCYGWIHVNQIQKAHYDISLTQKQVDGEMNLVLLSDLHLGAAGSQNRLAKVIETVQEAKPDLICIAGDIFDSDYNAMKNPEECMRLLQKLSAPYGVYACLGNHDAGKTFSQMISFLEQSNVTLLDDTYTVIDNRLILAGRLDGSPIGGYNGNTRKPLDQVLTGADSSLPVVVMDHNPVHGDSYQEGSAHLILSGHTHQGQIFPANLFTKMIYTKDYGYYQKNPNSPHHVITSGAGIWGMPMRVGTDTEIVTIRLY